jgi:hypothetical protein
MGCLNPDPFRLKPKERQANKALPQNYFTPEWASLIEGISNEIKRRRGEAFRSTYW